MYKIYTAFERGRMFHVHPKLWRVMKLSFFICLIAFVQVSASSLAQKINLNKRNAPLWETLNDIHKQTGYSVLCDPEILSNAKPVTVKIKDGSLEETLKACFIDQPFQYVINQKTILITPAKSPVPILSESVAAIKLTGKVTDEQGDLPGVSIKFKDSNIGTISDAKGNYALSVPDGKGTLVFTCVGYLTQEIPIEGRTTINVQLKVEAKGLNQIVVIGYGTVRKKDLTGSVSSIGANEIKSQPINSFNQALQGKVSGVQITQASNAPGGGITIRVRGGNSISASNDPLYVIDGFPISVPVAANGASGSGASYANPLSTINPNDIESIEVLKDASATAIYGSRGANGVVLVTTRRGKLGQANIEFETYAGEQQVVKKLKLGNAMDHLNLKNEQLVNLGFPLRFGNPGGAYPQPVASYGEGTDWQREIFRTAPVQSYQLSITGGSDKVKYLVSGNYLNQDGIVIVNNFKRYASRVNLDATLSGHVKIGSNLTASRTVNNGVSEGLVAGPIYEALTISPASPVYAADGNYQLLNLGPGTGFASTPNPVAVQNTSTNLLTTDRMLGNVFGDFSLTEGLKAHISFGADVQNSFRNVFFTPQTLAGSGRNGYGSNGTSENINTLNENTLTYTRKINANHAFDILAGVTFQSNRLQTTYQEAENFPNYVLGANNLSAANTLDITSSRLEKWGLNSYLARINYRFKGRYLFTVSAREDGSSRFGANNKYGFFPSGAFAWRISDENFLRNNPAISDLKFRASYGITGNDGIGLYNSLPQYTIGKTVFNDIEVLTNQVSRIENPDLKWEKTAQLDIGLDAGFWNNRITVVGDYYSKKTSGLLLYVDLPATTGATSVLRNIGSVQNKGFELAITSVNIDKGANGFKWTTAGNVSYNENKVTALANGVDHYFSGLTIIEVGKPLGSFYGNVFDGVWQTTQQIAAAGPLAQAGSLPGAYRWKDVNGDGVYNESTDRQVLGNGLPKFVFGLTNNFAYKEFDFSFFLQGVQGNKIYNTFTTLIDAQYNHLKSYYENHWTQSNPSNTVGGIRQWVLPAVSNFAIADGSFIRLKNVTFGYQLPTFTKIIKKARVYFSAQNLLTFTKYSGYDPEVNGDFNSNTVYGRDNFNYPPSRIYMLGLSATF
ncbi:TonB-linked SusC/RagA family outer membrane protein [Mucilaginibacter sp. SG538B]|uniref:TonB-dependent receptor n=1 Tax=Mucilaginibacter sp. SG538B TaxID=2587021 RepID=UPI00159DDA60|nr:TonB-dependent receptor [Mucilaginibacter sp. SG538B]NVM67300.1 TonB-linked SusC/RagA family outer membrane protein [Mucilaginibacter sp. SG538B]